MACHFLSDFHKSLFLVNFFIDFEQMIWWFDTSANDCILLYAFNALIKCGLFKLILNK